MDKKTILYFCPNLTTFIRRDIEMLSGDYRVKPFDLHQGDPLKLIPQLIRQFFFMLVNTWRASIFICHFAGYSSVLPVVFGKIFGKPCLIIVGGTDGAKFPKFNYGSYVKRVNGYFTAFSLRFATHIMPVHESLVYQDYTYDDAGAPAQGYTVFVPKAAKVPFTPVYYGYDADDFKPLDHFERKELTFITVGNLQQKSLYIRKGYDLIIELARRRPELSFTLVGWDGKTKLDTPPNVLLHRYMSQQELKEAFSSHEFYFQLSVMEGFPNALCEAMLCGCIPIGSNVSGIPYIIGDTGFVLKSRNVDDLDQIIEKIIRMENRSLLASAARKRISVNFPYHRRKNELVKLIEKYTSKKN